MKFFRSPGIVTIGINSSEIEFGYFQKRKDNIFELKNYKKQDLNSFEIIDSIIFNPTLVQSYIQNFFAENKIYQPNIYLYLTSSEKIKESIITCQKLNCSREELGISEDSTYIWGFDYMGFDNESHFYYVIGVTQELLFQYKILFSALPCMLMKITTKNIALLNTNKFANGNILDLKALITENLSNLELPKMDKYILSGDIKTSGNFLSASFGMMI